MKYRKYRKYRKYSKHKLKTKNKPKLKIRGHGIFGSTLKNFAAQWYRAVGRRWEEKKLRYDESWYPIRVTLPNGRTFLARYKRAKRSELPPNIIMRRTFMQRAASRGRRRRGRAQQGQGIFDFVKK